MRIWFNKFSILGYGIALNKHPVDLMSNSSFQVMSPLRHAAKPHGMSKPARKAGALVNSFYIHFGEVSGRPTEPA